MEFKKYIVTWTESHKIIVIATSESRAELDAIIASGEDESCIECEDFEAKEIIRSD